MNLTPQLLSGHKFCIQAGGNKPVLFKAPSSFKIKWFRWFRNAHYLSREQEKVLDQQLLNRRYKKSSDTSIEATNPYETKLEHTNINRKIRFTY